IGRTPAQLEGVQSVQRVRAFRAVVASGYAITAFLRIGVLQASMVVFLPVLVLIVIVTRVSAAQRERRLAAIRLVGATHGQTAMVAAVETGIAAAAGAALAWIGFEVGRRIVATTVLFQRGHFWLED